VRTVPLPISFFVVVIVTLALVVFFGAWVASADLEERDRVLSFGVPGGASFEAKGSSGTGEPLGIREAFAASDGNLESDSWWGNSFLKACPFH
jgi:hypothetical protein